MFPAHAGMNRSTYQMSTRRLNVPRTRGDEPDAVVEEIIDIGCSPHTRG